MTSNLSLTNVQFDLDENGVATLLMDLQHTSMNTLNPALAADLFGTLDRLEADPAIKAVVIGSAKPAGFLSGADVRWLRTLEDVSQATRLLGEAHAAFIRLEELATKHGKPTVAAIHGPCLGGGMELALACSMRIASDDEETTRMGLPEVQLGLIPGAGGTQRLPRLIGIAAALDLILTGKSARPRKALKLGLIDETVPVEVLIEIAKARALAAIGAPRSDGADGFSFGKFKSWLSPTHLQALALEDNSIGRNVLFSKAEAQMTETTRGNYPAPVAALRAVRVGIEEGITAGYATELDEFARLVTSHESKALMSVFLTSQGLRKDRGVLAKVEPRPVSKVAVLGGGLMGGGIAAVNTTRAGVHTRIKELDAEGVARGLKHVKKHLDGQVKRRHLKPRQADKALQMVTGASDWIGFGNSDLVIEAVFEDIALKQQMLAEVESVTSESTIFASNTSSIPIADIASTAIRPQNVIGMHYFSPVEKMPLLEVVVTRDTADWVIATCVEFGKLQGKTVIVVNDGTGFYTTRTLVPYANEVHHLLREGVSIEAIDLAMEAWGFPVGPVVLADEVGIDVGGKIGRIMETAFGDRMRVPGAFDLLMADDRKGRKNGRGFYTYENGKRCGVDSSVYAALEIETKIDMPHQEIQQRLSLQFVNEAARCLEDGVLRSARDGDIGAVLGLGFPPFTGGPFSYVDFIGAGEIVTRLDAFAIEHGERFEAAPILRSHATTDTLFRDDLP